MKILAFGFGTTPFFFKALIEQLQQVNEDVSWSIILPTSHYEKIMVDLLGAGSVVCLHHSLPSRMRENPEQSILGNYPGNIFKDIETEKITLKHREGSRQLNTALSTYSLFKHFVTHQQPDYILYAQPPEGMDGMVLANVASELGVPIAVPHHTRNIGLSFFSKGPQEVLPDYGLPDQDSRECAVKFLKNFRSKHIDPAGFLKADADDELVTFAFPPRLQRIRGYFERLWKEPEKRELGVLRVSLLNSWFPFYRDFYRGMRKLKNARYYNCDDLSSLPKKFIFYPLQYTPESSINVPAPYFVDQLRIIDSIRMSMPSDTLLVVKEHPACVAVRPGAFVKNLLRKAGVVVARYDIETQEIIKRSSLTITVTGTAAFEAFLYGKASLIMGPAFFAEFLGGECGLDQVGGRIKESMSKKIPDEQIIDALSRIYHVSSSFYGRAPGEIGERMMRKNNIIEFWNAFIRHKKFASTTKVE